MDNLPTLKYTGKYTGNRHLAVTYDEVCFFEKLHKHDFYEIEYIYDGNGVQIIDNIPYNVRTGDIVFLSPDNEHLYYSVNDMKIINTCFPVSVFMEYVYSLNFERKIISLNKSDKIVFENIIFLLENELKTHNEFNNICQSYLSVMISLISRNNNNNNVIISDFWQPIISFITLHLNTVTLDEICKISKLSKNYFCKKFKSTFKMTFVEYLSMLKIQHAKRLLLTTELSVTEIMYQVGYTNSKLFYKNFNLHTGTTPRKYRLQNKTGESRDLKNIFSKTPICLNNID